MLGASNIVRVYSNLATVDNSEGIRNLTLNYPTTETKHSSEKSSKTAKIGHYTNLRQSAPQIKTEISTPGTNKNYKFDKGSILITFT